jgi:rare lipoprotein A (peptidoglycan hydrolase)
MEGEAQEQQAVASSIVADVLVILLGISIIVGVAVGAGLLAAHLREVNTPVNLSWRSVAPLTSAALLAELQPPPDINALLDAVRGAADSPPGAPVAPSAAASGTPQASQIQTGAEMAVGNLETGGCLNLRDSPSTNGHVLRCLPAGQTVRLLAGPKDADGYRWWQVDQGGWLAESYLASVSVQSQTTMAAAGGAQQVPPIAAGAAQSLARRYTGWATNGIEDLFHRGDAMDDGTAFNPADPTIAAASSQLPLHSWLLVCSPARCIVVQVRDRGRVDANGALVDLSRAAYAQLFGLPSSDFLSIIRRESGGIPTATCFAPGSDASQCTSTPKPGDTQGAFGPFQFLNSTWNGLGCFPAAPANPLGVNYAAYNVQASAECAARSYLQSGLSAWGGSGSGGKQQVTVFVIDSGLVSLFPQ